MSGWWFLIYLGLSIGAAIYADRRGRSGIGFFFLAVFISPILAFLFAAITPNKAIVAQRKLASGIGKCPFCAEPVRAEAIKCKHCGSELKRSPAATYPYRCKLCGDRSPDSTAALAHAGSRHGLRGAAMDETVEALR